MSDTQDRMITVSAFDHSHEAHLFRCYLEEHEIESYVHDENVLSLKPFLGYALGGIKVRVNSSDIEKAREVLAEFRSAPVLNDDDITITCPFCGSTNIDTSYRIGSVIRSLLVAVVSMLTQTFAAFTERRCYCRDCREPFDRV